MLTSPAFLLRIALGLVFVFAPITMGSLGRSPWIIPLLGVVFAISFVLGKWSSWGNRTSGTFWSNAIAGFPVTLLIQTGLVAALYLIGLGGSMLFGRTGFASELGQADYFTAGAVLLAGLCALLIPGFDLPSAALVPSPPTGGATSGADSTLHISSEPVTPERFFVGIHYSHGTYLEGGGFDATPSARSAGSDAKIAEAETRLGVRLPEGLKALYRIQNGGSVGDLVIAKVADPQPNYEDWASPFIGYSDLYPLERLRTVYEAVCDYADPDLEADAQQFPRDCRNMIVLAQWYRHTLFLDYREGETPRVGFADFDLDNHEASTMWFDTFEDFFAKLRRVDSPP